MLRASFCPPGTVLVRSPGWIRDRSLRASLGPGSPYSGAVTIEHDVAGLRYTDRFVRELPGDPRDDNRIRQVLGACYSRVAPTAVARPELLVLVPEVAALLELEPHA